MSDTMHYVIAVGGMAAVTLPFTVFQWRHADRDAVKLIARLTPPDHIEFTEPASNWLRSQFARRSRWTASASQIAVVIAAALIFGSRGTQVLRETAGPLTSGAAMFVGIALGGTLAQVWSACAATGTKRTASLTPRSAGTYLRPWERWLFRAHLVVATGTLAATILALGTSAVSGHTAAFYLAVTSGWLVAVGSIALMQRWILRSPPVVDEPTHIARELTISLAVRTLLLLQLEVAMIVGYLLCTYLYVTVSGLPWLLSTAPIWVAVAIAAAAGIARLERRERGRPSPEWYFARTLEPTS